jgi:molecular chaperone GrpE
MHDELQQVAEATSDAPADQPTMSSADEKEALIAALQQELAAEKAKAQDYYDKLQRTVAESANTRKRMEKQLADSIDRASAHIIMRILPVIDDLDLAFRNLPESVNDETAAWLNGFRQIQKKLENILEEQQVVKFVDTGALDPSRHEAISSEAHPEIESGHIIDTLRPGYEQKGRILRAAMVRVAS